MSIRARTFALLLTAGTAAAGLGILALQPHATAAPAAAAAPAPSVDVAPVLVRQVTDWQYYSGRLEAVDRVEIRPQVSGRITAVHFRNGALVKQGDLLFTIDPRPYQAELARAEADLAAARAQVEFTRADLERARALIAKGHIAERTLDEKQNAARAAAAAVQSAQAAIAAARVNLDYTTVTAPVSGRISRAELTVGNVVAAGPTAPLLTTLVSVSPIYAGFDVDEQTYLTYIGGLKDAAAVPVEMGLANEEGYSRHGVVEHVDNRLDTASGTIRVRARFDNPDAVLVPGLYARIKLGGSRPHEAVLVDERAVGTDQDRKFVLIANDKDIVEYRPVTLGSLYQGLRVVTAGLKPGERVIVNGLQHARPGQPVQPRSVAMDAPRTTQAASL